LPSAADESRRETWIESMVDCLAFISSTNSLSIVDKTWEIAL
jgi:hypothetical protein